MIRLEKISKDNYRECLRLQVEECQMRFVSSNSASLARYQGNGYGKQAMKLVIEQIKSERKYPKIILCYIDGDEAAKRLYGGLGYYHTGEVDENEIIMRFDL